MSDLISRADAIEAVEKCIVESELLSDWNKAMKSAQDLLSALPSADAEQGEWMHDGSQWANRWVCDKCGHKIFEPQTNFCPSCGARMKGGTE